MTSGGQKIGGALHRRPRHPLSVYQIIISLLIVLKQLRNKISTRYLFIILYKIKGSDFKNHYMFKNFVKVGHFKRSLAILGQ